MCLSQILFFAKSINLNYIVGSFFKLKPKTMKIKIFLTAFVTFLVLTFSFGIISLSTNDVQAAPTSASSVVDKAELEYVYVFENGGWWVYVYDGGKLIDIYAEDDYIKFKIIIRSKAVSSKK